MEDEQELPDRTEVCRPISAEDVERAIAARPPTRPESEVPPTRRTVTNLSRAMRTIE